ncbi:MAG: hypothetical protein QOH12_3040 [Solirubrobacteraceae bacterium]|nr:hypothetical protein [Solirubrobacteraceae bacterium]
MNTRLDVELDGALAEFVHAFAFLHWDRFRDCFSDEAEVFFPSADEPTRASGRATIDRIFGGVFARARRAREGPPYLDLEPSDLKIRRFGDTALVTFHLVDPGVLCRRTLVLRYADNRWLIVHLHASNIAA